MTSSIFQATLLLPALAVASAIGLAAPASEAWAQAPQGGQSAKSATTAKASEPATVPGVVVQAPKPNGVPPEKKKALDAQAAKRKAWTKYRTAPAAPTAKATSAAPGTTSASARAEDYPGLHDLGSH